MTIDPSSTTHLSNQDEINDFIFNWFLTEGTDQATTRKLLADLSLLFELTSAQALQFVKDQYKYFKQLQRRAESQQLETSNGNLSSTTDPEHSANAFDLLANRLTKAHVLFFPGLSQTANLVLSTFFNTKNSASSIRTALIRFQRISDKSEWDFRYHINRLYTRGYLILQSKGNPQLFKLNKDIFNAFAKSSNVGPQSSKPIAQTPEILNGPEIDPEPFPNVTNPVSNSEIQLNLHNIIAYIPCEIADLVFAELRAKKHDFILKREDSNLRYWGKDQAFALHGDTFTCSILIYRKSIELKFLEDQGTDIILQVGAIMERIFHILSWLKERLIFIKFPVESDFKLYNSTGQIYHLEVEFENLLTDLLVEYVKATGKHEEWWLIDDQGNKIGFDSSCRIAGTKRIPKIEMKGDVVTLVPNLMNQFSAMAKGSVNVVETSLKTRILEKKFDQLDHEVTMVNQKITLVDSFTDKNITHLHEKIDSLHQATEHTFQQQDTKIKDLYTNQEDFVDILDTTHKSITNLTHFYASKEDLKLTSKDLNQLTGFVLDLAKIVYSEKPSFFSKITKKFKFWSTG